MKFDKMKSICDNLENGNVSDFRKQIKHLKKFEIVELIRFYNGFYWTNPEIIKRFLERLSANLQA